MKHFIVSGFSGVGKTTLVNKVIDTTSRKVYGFSTAAFPELEDRYEGFAPIFIYPAGKKPIFDDEHLIGLGGQGNHYTNADVFDSVGVDLISCTDPNALIIMDEIGFLEMSAEKFQAKVFDCLKGDTPCLIILKMKMDVEFIKKLSTISDAEYIILDEANRGEVSERILSALA